jgi:uncharacterized protein YjbI with pentapeptide repeats
MKLKEAYEIYKKFKVPSLSKIRDVASENSKTSLVIIIFLVMFLLLALQYIPHYQVAQFNITNQKDLADAENSYRATLAQIFGGVAIAIGIYYTWRRITIAEEDLKSTKEGQITERFTRAIDQLGAVDKDGNPAIEIRLGAIYALERIADESDQDYWAIIEILTAYVRKNSPYEKIKGKEIDYNPFHNVINKKEESIVEKKPFDIQAILTVIGRRKYSPYSGETEYLDLSKTNLSGYNLTGANLKQADLQEANLQEINLCYANLKGAYLNYANIQGASLHFVNLSGAFLKRVKLQWADFWLADLENANLQEADLKNAFLHEVNFENANLGNDTDYNPKLWGLDLAHGANLEDAHLSKANLKKSNLKWANLKGAVFSDANFEGANLDQANLENTKFERANLRGAKNLTVEQLSKVKTLYKAQLDEGLEEELRAKGFGHLLDDKP